MATYQNMDAGEFQVRRGRTRRRAIIEANNVVDERDPSRDRTTTTMATTSTPEATTSAEVSRNPVTIPIESALLPGTAFIASSALSSSTSTPTTIPNLPDTNSGFQAPLDKVGTSGPSPLTLLGISIGLTLAISLVVLIYLARRCHQHRVIRRSRQLATPMPRGNRQSIWGCGQTDISAAPTPRTSFQYNAYIPPMVQKAPSPAEILFKDETGVARPVRLFARRESVQSPPLPLERRPSTGGVMNSKVFVRPLPRNEIGAARTSALWVNPKLPIPIALPTREKAETPLNEDGFRLPVSTTPDKLDKDQASSLPILKHFSFSSPPACNPQSPISAVDPKELGFSEFDATETTSTLGDGWANPSLAHNSVGFAANLTAPSPHPKIVKYSPLKTEVLSPALFVVPLREEEDVEIPGTLPRWTDPLTWAKDQSRRNASRSEEGGKGPACDAV